MNNSYIEFSSGSCTWRIYLKEQKFTVEREFSTWYKDKWHTPTDTIRVKDRKSLIALLRLSFSSNMRADQIQMRLTTLDNKNRIVAKYPHLQFDPSSERPLTEQEIAVVEKYLIDFLDVQEGFIDFTPAE